eukprot:TRINITY_DN2662_c0_g1_i1.p1 TRINITY_DN2662_c0_g1~~TRINITY_DN2662_c0_g1_i1.p1  ORF type:complete len:442 (+),score=165.17 TRINITY_DN2662_c0_g1_i1:198-1328(+)
MDTGANAQTWASAQSGEAMAQLARFHEQKLWHQLSEALMEVLQKEEHDAKFLSELYENFLKSFQKKLNALRLAQMVVIIGAKFEKGEKKALLEQTCEVVQESREAVAFLKSHIALVLLGEGSTVACRDLLDEVRETLDDIVGADATVYVAYYDAKARYHKENGPFEEYYRNGLMCLAYLPLSKLSQTEQQETAFSLCIASLVGEGIYSFGELLSQPIMESLVGSDKEWIVKVVNAFNSGDIKAYGALQKEYKAQLNAESVLVENIQSMREKISVLCLMEEVFKRPSDERTISFDAIASVAELEANEVEFLLMKALASKLVRGKINEVEQNVTFSWVQPRALSLEQIAALRDRVGAWQGKTKDVLLDMEGQVGPLLQ